MGNQSIVRKGHQPQNLLVLAVHIQKLKHQLLCLVIFFLVYFVAGHSQLCHIVGGKTVQKLLPEPAGFFFFLQSPLSVSTIEKNIIILSGVLKQPVDEQPGSGRQHFIQAAVFTVGKLQSIRIRGAGKLGCADGSFSFDSGIVFRIIRLGQLWLAEGL